MWYYIKKYPFSLLVLVIVIYLSFFRPPSLHFPLFPGFDKLIHFIMYAGVSGVLWVEFLWNHRKGKLPVKRGVIGAMVCPIAFSGLIELGQEYLTTYRGGDWMDFLANTTGVLIASFLAWCVIRPWLVKRFA